MTRGFTLQELEDLLRKGGYDEHTLETHFFYRFLLILPGAGPGATRHERSGQGRSPRGAHLRREFCNRIKVFREPGTTPWREVCSQ